MQEQSGSDSLKNAAADLLAAITKLVNSGASALESLAGEMVKGSGNVIQKQYDLSGFTGVDIGSAFRGEVKRGDNWHVVVTADDNVIDCVRVTLEEKTLRVRVEGFRVAPTQLRVDVTMPTIEALAVGGASHIALGGFDPVPAFAALLTGASHLNGEIRAEATTVNASGASKVELRGEASSLMLTASGASHAGLAELPVATADVTLSGASHAAINAAQRIDLRASGASHLAYSGDATLANSQTSGGSSVSRR